MSQDRLQFIHLFNNVTDRGTYQTVIQDVGTGLNVLYRYLIFKSEGLVFGMSLIGNEYCYRGIAVQREQSDMRQDPEPRK